MTAPPDIDVVGLMNPTPPEVDVIGLDADDTRPPTPPPTLTAGVEAAP